MKPDRTERGFTLIEVLVVVSILGIIMSAVASAIITVTRTFGATAERISQSHDAQLLSRWLVPDLQSASTPLPPGWLTAAAPPAGVTCPSGDPFSQMQLSWTDAADSTAYVATYAVTASFDLERTLAVTPLAGATTSETFVVVHNLADPTQPLPTGTPRYPACIQRTVDDKVTVTITTLVKNGESQFTFSVTAQTRQPYAPPLPLPPPDPVSVDEDEDGTLDSIRVQFDQAVFCAGSCQAGSWEIGGAPGLAPTVAPASVAIDSTNNKRVLLAVSTTALDTRATGMTVKLVSGNLMAAAGPVPGFGPTAVLDRMAPVLASATSQDLDSSGTLDRVTVRFSETLATAPGVNDYKLLNGPAGNPDPTAVLQTSPLEYAVAFTTTAIDTVAAGAELRITRNSASDGVKTNPPDDQPVSDGMAPVIDTSVPIVAKDANAVTPNGRVDRVEMAFTETLATAYTAPGTVWGLPGAPSGATLSSVLINGKQVRLGLSEGTGAANTSTSGFTVALNADAGGLRDAAGNKVSFGPKPVADRMSPVIVSLTAAGGVAGMVEANDVLTVGFSETVTVASVPSSIIVDRSGGNTIFTLGDLLSVVMGSNGYTSNADLTCGTSVSASPDSATFTVTLLTCSGAQNTVASDTGTATPVATLRDAADVPNGPGGSFAVPIVPGAWF